MTYSIDVNKLLISGHIVALGPMGHTQRGEAVRSIYIESHSAYSGKNGELRSNHEDVEVTIRGGCAEKTFVDIGDKVLIEGQLMTHVWTSGTGKQCKRLSVVGKRVHILGNE